MLFGLFPALHSTRPDLITALKGHLGPAVRRQSASRFRTSLAVAQIALSMALLVSAGLFTRSLFNVSRVDLGLKADHVVMFSISPELNGYAPEKSRQLFERVEDELRALPGVTGVTSATVPAGWQQLGQRVAVEGFQAGPDTDTESRFNVFGPGYFRRSGCRSWPDANSRAAIVGAPRVAIVNEAFAKKFNLGRDAVGKRMGDGGADGKLTMEIVGLVQNAKYSDVKKEIPPHSSARRQDETRRVITFYARTSTDPDHSFRTSRRSSRGSTRSCRSRI